MAQKGDHSKKYTLEMLRWMVENSGRFSSAKEMYLSFCAKYGEVVTFEGFCSKAYRNLKIRIGKREHRYTSDERAWIKSNVRKFYSMDEAYKSYAKRFENAASKIGFYSYCYKQMNVSLGRKQSNYPLYTISVRRDGDKVFHSVKYRTKGGIKKNFKRIPENVYENNKIVPNCIMAYLEVYQCEKELKK